MYTLVYRLAESVQVSVHVRCTVHVRGNMDIPGYVMQTSAVNCTSLQTASVGVNDTVCFAALTNFQVARHAKQLGTNNFRSTK